MAMSQEHRDALKQGRAEARAIKAYLEAVGRRRPGRPVTAESLTKRVTNLQEKIDAEANPLKRIELMQRQIDAQNALADLEEAPDLDILETEFVRYAKSYSTRKGISYSAWRAGGVPAATLKKAGISRAGST